MAQPFKCPKCGSKDYVVVLTGCNITGATLHDAYTWSEEEQEYSFGGDRKSTRLNSSHIQKSRMPSSA